MSHSLDFQGLHARLFVLRHIIAGCRELCRRDGYSQIIDEDNWGEEWGNYATDLRRHVIDELMA
jgi:hypothetical protein